uniref:Ty3 transposon capsid-like protein domain-containing protein n=1 Tax=Fundulus heteroclitus TaxID=8078 RepID=A0A3Q2QID3_FUNHE
EEITDSDKTDVIAAATRASSYVNPITSPTMTEEHSGQTEALGRTITAQQEQIRGLEAAVGGLQSQLQGMAAQLAQLVNIGAPPPVAESSSPPPEKFAGDAESCGGFLFQCALVFNRAPHTFAPDYARISYILRLLTGRALRWAESRFPDCQQFDCSFSEFIAEFKTVFAAEADETHDSQRLLTLRQRGRRVADYAVEFRKITSSLMPCPACTPPPTRLRNQQPSCLPPVC